MSLTHDNLRSKVLWRPAQRIAPIFNLLCKPKIRDPQMAVSTDEQILRLEVAIRNLFGMQILQSQRNFCDIEKSHIIGKEALLPEQSKYLPALNKFKNQIEVCLIRK